MGISDELMWRYWELLTDASVMEIAAMKCIASQRALLAITDCCNEGWSEIAVMKCIVSRRAPLAMTNRNETAAGL